MSDRRLFLKQALAGSAAISLSGTMPRFLLGASRDANRTREEKILVVVQLSGGNDGLNTIVPYGDDNYYKNRFTLAIGKNSVLKIDDHVGFHPSLTGLEQLLQQRQLAIVQGVGYPNPNRSHFESMDLWHSAHRIDESTRLGWLGRTIDRYLQHEDLPALHFGDGLQPLALRNERKPVPSIQSIDNFRLDILRDRQLGKRLKPLMQAPRGPGNELLSYIHASATVALETSHQIESIERKNIRDYGYPGTSLGRNLGLIAQLIGSGLDTRIYYTSLGGFDTHSNQSEAHAGLLSNWSNSILAFMKQLADQGNSKRVAVVSFSEFGRRVRENASRGTDHGTAAPLFVVGPQVKAGLIGDHPSLAAPQLMDGDMKFRIDYRRVYAELLQSWLGIDPGPIVGAEHSPLKVFHS